MRRRGEKTHEWRQSNGPAWCALWQRNALFWKYPCRECRASWIDIPRFLSVLRSHELEFLLNRSTHPHPAQRPVTSSSRRAHHCVRLLFSLVRLPLRHQTTTLPPPTSVSHFRQTTRLLQVTFRSKHPTAVRGRPRRALFPHSLKRQHCLLSQKHATSHLDHTQNQQHNMGRVKQTGGSPAHANSL